MLIYYLLQLPITFVNSLTSWIPHVEALPFGLDSLLSNGFSYFFYVVTVVPPLETLYNAFLWVVGFKITMRLLLMIPLVGRMFR
jgi:hypothetical protein